MSFVNPSVVSKAVILGVVFFARFSAVKGESTSIPNLERYSLGFLDMSLKSKSSSETNLLLKTLLSVTVTFLDNSFHKQMAVVNATTNSSIYRSVSCSIHDFQMSSHKKGSLGTANVTISGFAYFATPHGITPSISNQNVSEWTALAFEADVGRDGSSGSFVQALTDSPDPFLSNITYAAVYVDGTVVEADIMNGRGDGSTRSNDSSPFAVLEIWMIPLIGGGGAFLLVLCCIITCICCMRVDEKNGLHKSMDRGTGAADGGASDPQMAGVVTIPTTPQADDEEDGMMHSLPPSPTKSIGSQDSSTFTYNPKSVRSFDNRSVTSYYSYKNGMEMDLNAWQNGPAASTTAASKDPTMAQPMFGHDISAIEDPKRDLSFIREGDDESACSPLDLSVASKSRHSGSGKYKSLLSRCHGDGAEQLARDNETKPRGCKLTFGHQQRDDDRDDEDYSDDNSSFFGPSQIDDSSRGASAANTPHRLNLSGSAAEVLNDLHNLSSEIDLVRGSMSSTHTVGAASSYGSVHKSNHPYHSRF